MEAPPPADAQTFARLTATELAFFVHGFIPLLRDVNELIYKAVEASEPIDPSEAAGWVLRLDTLTNMLTNTSDECADDLRKCGVDAPLAWGTTVQRVL
jgi:hypothetical protein